MMRSRMGMALAAVCALVPLLASCTSTPPPSPTTTTKVTPTGHDLSQIVIGVDEFSEGYNPHAIADISPVTQALAQLMLPSVFRPDAEGDPELDKTLMRSARVVSKDPFTVAYTIRPDASWSDGAPIAAEDFIYLADVMRSEPGTVAPAGYRLIDEVASRRGGKRVEVTFSEPYRGWRHLFSHLLPAHLLKDVPGGWQAALKNSFPSYGGPFAIKSIDTARGEILLERNERYWEKPAAVDQLVLRQSDQQGIAAALRNGNNQFALSRTGAVGLEALRQLGDRVELHTVARPEVAEVLLRPIGEVLADDDARAGIAALLDRDKLIAAGVDGGPSAKLRADAQLASPTEDGYRPTIPAKAASPDPRRAEGLLEQAGYRKSAGRWQSFGGEPLSLTVASPGKREPYAAIANELTEQLADAGIKARAVTPDPRELFATDPAGPDAEPVAGGDGVHIVVAPRPVGADDAATFASRFGCRAQRDPESSDSAMAPGNVAGFCEKRVQEFIDATVTGDRPLAPSVDEVEPLLWRANVTIPLFQLADTLALTGDVAGVSAGPPLAGPFGSAVNWIRTGE